MTEPRADVPRNDTGSAQTTCRIIASDGRQWQAKVLLPGPTGARTVAGQGLALTAPISFWGGVDPATGRIADVRHPQHGLCISGRVLMLPGVIGSSSASAVLLELIHRAIAPAAIIMHEPDAILLLGAMAAREMGWDFPPACQLDRRHFAAMDGVGLKVG